MIKNKTLSVKIFFKTYLKTLKIFFYFTKYRITNFKNCFSILFSKIAIK